MLTAIYIVLIVLGTLVAAFFILPFFGMRVYSDQKLIDDYKRADLERKNNFEKMEKKTRDHYEALIEGWKARLERVKEIRDQSQIKLGEVVLRQQKLEKELTQKKLAIKNADAKIARQKKQIDAAKNAPNRVLVAVEDMAEDFKNAEQYAARFKRKRQLTKDIKDRLNAIVQASQN